MKTYSIFEAKARLSEVLRHVKAGLEIKIQERGKTIAKIIPANDENEITFEDKIIELEKNGLITKAQTSSQMNPKLFEKIPSALNLFLKDRE